MTHFVISKIAHRKIRRYTLSTVRTARYHTDMQKVSPPAPQSVSARRKALMREYSDGSRLNKGYLYGAILVSAMLLLLTTLLILPGQITLSDVEISYTQPITAVHASAVPAGESLSGSKDPGMGAGHPKADLSSGFYDFGSLSHEAVVEHDFLVVNHGDAPLVIREAHTTCGCTTANLTASVIPPGQASRITMIFNAGFHDVTGQTVRRGLLISTNDPDHPELEIWVQASVR
jgi:hypothetical protein